LLYRLAYNASLEPQAIPNPANKRFVLVLPYAGRDRVLAIRDPDDGL
jgi:hypothetical protein